LSRRTPPASGQKSDSTTEVISADSIFLNSVSLASGERTFGEKDDSVVGIEL
jgi:hypothetical protein